MLLFLWILQSISPMNGLNSPTYSPQRNKTSRRLRPFFHGSNRHLISIHLYPLTSSLPRPAPETHFNIPEARNVTLFFSWYVGNGPLVPNGKCLLCCTASFSTQFPCIEFFPPQLIHSSFFSCCRYLRWQALISPPTMIGISCCRNFSPSRMVPSLSSS